MKEIKLPIKVLTKKLATNKTDSIFYAGKNIASLKVGNREYVLTTAGEYDFSLAIPKTTKGIKSTLYMEYDSLPKNIPLTDARIKKLTEDGCLVSNWGWFGINLWIDDRCIDVPTDAYSTYDEAMTAFIDFIQKDLTR